MRDRNRQRQIEEIFFLCDGMMEQVKYPGDPTNGNYIRGYTAALQDVKEVVGYIRGDLRHHHKSLNAKTLDILLDFMIKNRAALRENTDAFIRCNDAVEGGFEIFEPE